MDYRYCNIRQPRLQHQINPDLLSNKFQVQSDSRLNVFQPHLSLAPSLLTLLL